jgi:pimeloyl-ACP methyl ester carboxylesterase
VPASVPTEHRETVNGVEFGYLELGTGPLALCLHGFPDAAPTWRHLMPALADAGHRAVAPWMRGYAPTAVPADGRYEVAALAVDACELHEALGGDGDAVIIGHDWGAIATWTAANWQPERWRRVVGMAVPPPAAIAGAFFQYEQLHRSWYMFFFQHPLAGMVVPMGDLAFIDGLWRDWSPGYDATEDLPGVKAALQGQANVDAALGYYRAMLGDGLKDPELAPVTAAGANPVAQPALYLHGRDDGCMGAEFAPLAAPFLADPASRVEVLEDCGHFLHLERPDAVNRLVLDFLA